MMENVSIELPEGTWVDITDGLADDTNYFVQNIGNVFVKVSENSSSPSGIGSGFRIRPLEFITVRPTLTTQIYARSESGAGLLELSEAI